MAALDLVDRCSLWRPRSLIHLSRPFLKSAPISSTQIIVASRRNEFPKFTVLGVFSPRFFLLPSLCSLCCEPWSFLVPRPAHDFSDRTYQPSRALLLRHTWPIGRGTVVLLEKLSPGSTPPPPTYPRFLCEVKVPTSGWQTRPGSLGHEKNLRSRFIFSFRSGRSSYSLSEHQVCQR